MELRTLSFNRLLSPKQKAEMLRNNLIGLGVYLVLILTAGIASSVPIRDSYEWAKPLAVTICAGTIIAFAAIRWKVYQNEIAAFWRIENDLQSRFPGEIIHEQSTVWGKLAHGKDWIGATYKPMQTLWVSGDQIDGVIRGCDQWSDARMLRDPYATVPRVSELNGHWLMLLTDKAGADVILVPLPTREDSVWWFEAAKRLADGEPVEPRPKEPWWRKRYISSDISRLRDQQISFLIFIIFMPTVIVATILLKSKGVGIFSAMYWFWILFGSLNRTQVLMPGIAMARAWASPTIEATLASDRQILGPSRGRLFISTQDAAFDLIALTDIDEIEVRERRPTLLERDLSGGRVENKTTLVLNLNRDHDAELKFDLPAEQAYRICDSVREELGIRMKTPRS